MNTKAAVKLFLDVIMTALLVLLTFEFGTSLFFHEVAGIAVYALFALHIVLNIKPVAGLLKAGFKKANKRALLFLIIDTLFAVGMIVILISGILISKILFPLNISNTDFASSLHTVASYICIGVLGVHLLLHASYLVSGFKKLFISLFTLHTGKSPARRVFAGFAVSVGAAAVIYSQAYPVYLESLSINSVTEGLSEAEKAANTSDITDTGSKSSDSSGTDSSQTTTQDEDKKSQDTTSGTQTAAAQTLNEFLSNLFCSGCHRHCSLISPACSRGVSQASEATARYEAEYGDQ
jgi:hypothetical protein